MQSSIYVCVRRHVWVYACMYIIIINWFKTSEVSKSFYYYGTVSYGQKLMHVRF